MPGALDILVSSLAVALGLFITASPARAAKVWSADRIAKLTPARRVWFLRCYRVFGVMISLAGVLFVLDSMGQVR